MTADAAGACPVEFARTAGGYHATCGGCLATSPSVAASNDVEAWAVLVAAGWTAYQHVAGVSRVYPHCPACASRPVQTHPRRSARKRKHA